MLFAFLYMIALSLFNLSDTWCDTKLPICFYDMPTCYIYVSAFFYISIFLPLAGLYFKLGKLEFHSKKRLVYYCASVLSGIYCVWSAATILSKDIAILLNRWESVVWSIIFALVVILLFVYLLYKFICND